MRITAVSHNAPSLLNAGARCSSGQLSLEPGYWSESATDVANVTSDTVFIQCLFVDACLAVDNGTRHECRFPNRGYDNLATRRGALATHASCVLRVVLGSRLCALCEDGHTTFGGGCVACPAPGANVAIVVALAAMVVAGLSYLVFRKPVDKARSASAGVVRIGINFFQLVRRPLMWLWWWFRCSGGGAVVAADGGRAGSVDTLVLYLCWYCTSRCLRLHMLQNAGVGALRMHKSTFMQQYLDIRCVAAEEALYAAARDQFSYAPPSLRATVAPATAYPLTSSLFVACWIVRTIHRC